VKTITASIAFLLVICTMRAETPIETFLKKHSDTIYQDIVIGDKIYSIGTDYCEPRYKLIRPILDRFNGPFSVLDVGAAQGYFSFLIAQDYPRSSCVMIEANNTFHYANHGDMLYDLCLLNSHLHNITYLQKRINLSDLSFLNAHEHFDVIIAFLVVHQVGGGSLQKQIEILKSLLTLGDNLLLEVANDVSIVYSAYAEYLSKALDAQYLGEVKRHKDPKSQSTGKLFWFKSKASGTVRRNIPIQTATFLHFNGVYQSEAK